MQLTEDLNNKKLWRDYIRDQSEEKRNDLVVAYRDLARKIASQVYKTLPNSVSLDDLRSYAVKGLIDAVERFDPELGVTFLNYAPYRIKGQILDEIRKEDWVPKKIRQRQNQLKRSIHELRSDLDRQPTKLEIAEAEEITLDELWDLQMGIEKRNKYRLNNNNTKPEQEEIIEQRTEPDPDRKAIKGDFLWEICKEIPPKRRLIFLLIHKEQLHLRQVAEIIDLNPPQISNLQNRTLDELSEKLDESKLRGLL